MKKYLLIFLLIQQLHAQQTDILFIGNSYTYTNNLPDMLYRLALAGGDTIVHNSSTPGGYTFQMHSQDNNTLAAINQRTWNYVILQGQSQEPAIDTAYVEANVFPYATLLDSLIHENDSCTQTIFFMTWGRKNGDASYCSQYPPVCTYTGMQDQLRGRYVQMAQDNHAIVAPVGEAWRNVIATNPAFDLYSPDESHPSIYGTYLGACVLYATIYRQSPAGLNYYGGLTQSDALFLQTIAGTTVLDSIATWNTEIYYPDASFGVTQAGINSVNVNADYPSAVSLSWDDGTGNGFIAGNASETFTYPAANNYTICLAASNGCRTDTFCMLINPATVGATENNATALLVFPNPSDGNVSIKLPGGPATVKFYSLEGNLVLEKSTTEKTLLLENLPPAIYFVEINAGTISVRTKLVIVQ
ncbi:MAG: T9SS type A sorting domain-containing protein [Bacteroidia bacterium]